MRRRQSQFWVCGVDPGSRIATLCFADVTGRADPIFARAVGQNALETAQNAFQVAEQNFLYFDPIVIWVEEPRGQNSRAVHLLSVVSGGVIAAAKGHSVEFVSAGEWKTLIGLKGNAKKADVRSWVLAELPHVRRLDEHMNDAYGISQAIIRYGEKEDHDDHDEHGSGADQGARAAGGGAGERRGSLVAACRRGGEAAGRREGRGGRVSAGGDEAGG